MLALNATVPTLLYQLLGWKWLTLPWAPIATVGTAAAFLLAFRNNSTYDRLWKARIIWGAIVNLSRTWAIQVRDLVSAGPPEAQQFTRTLVRRHFAWLTALRFQLRQRRRWERMDQTVNREYLGVYEVPEWDGDLDAEMRPYAQEAQWERLKVTRNPAAQIISLQSEDLKAAFDRGWLDSIRLSQLVGTLGRLHELAETGERRCGSRFQ
ncbi:MULTISPECIES: bestrophin family ion channel [Corallococcus]|uniref:bestrophin family ion channel n=1 Tax=Corallococcus TaxID=83461 RepID=UPI0013153F91|nr:MULTISPECIES: bestrophin family ion channel [Corallococcus]